jgi:hypothetical protein
VGFEHSPRRDEGWGSGKFERGGYENGAATFM